MNATIDEAIERVEQLYVTLVGRPPQTGNGRRVPIPPEVDPIVHVEAQLKRLLAAIDQVPPAQPAWSPRAVLWFHDHEPVISIDVPGVLARDVRIRVEPFALVVRGQRRPPWRHLPRAPMGDVPMGAFARAFRLATRVSPDRISARLDDGVLTIRIHETARTEPSQISIEE